MGSRLEHRVANVSETPAEEAVGEPIPEDTLGRILERGVLRVGYTRDRLPWAFRNAQGELVGFDVEMAQVLAAELGVDLSFTRLDAPPLGSLLDTGRVDVMMSGIVLTTRRLGEMSFSAPYTDETIAFVVRDHRRDEFGSRAAVQALRSPHIAVPNAPYYIEKLERYLPEARVTVVNGPRDFFEAEPGKFDAMLFTAESGSAWSLVYPQFTVAVPRPDILGAPLAYAVRRDDTRMAEVLSGWIALKQRDGTIERLYDYWILGRVPPKVNPRWSVWRDVLGRGGSGEGD
jgi:ABC-type amino acid transport substrate-binding protein